MITLQALQDLVVQSLPETAESETVFNVNQFYETMCYLTTLQITVKALSKLLTYSHFLVLLPNIAITTGTSTTTPSSLVVTTETATSPVSNTAEVPAAAEQGCQCVSVLVGQRVERMLE